MNDVVHQSFVDEIFCMVLKDILPAADARLYIRAVSERWPATAVFDRSILSAIRAHYPQETSLVEAMQLWESVDV